MTSPSQNNQPSNQPNNQPINQSSLQSVHKVPVDVDVDGSVVWISSHRGVEQQIDTAQRLIARLIARSIARLSLHGLGDAVAKSIKVATSLQHIAIIEGQSNQL